MSLEKLKIKQMLKKLESCRGNGTSLVSIMIGAGGDLNGTKKRLTDEYGKASNVKSRVNRQSILSALTSAQQKLKQYRTLPPNGLVLFCGDTFVGTKTKMINIAFEPFKPLHHKMYFCDNQFHVEPLYDLLKSEDSYGFVVLDGNGAVFGRCQVITKRYWSSIPSRYPSNTKQADNLLQDSID